MLIGETPVVKTENLTKEFKPDSIIRRHSIKALDNLDLQIDRGEIFGYLGPNGAGKTTTFKLLLGLIFPTSGAAWVLGSRVSEVEFKKRVGFLPEQPYFYDYLTGEEFLDFYAQLFRFDKNTRRQKVETLLDTVGLGKAATKQLRKYSKGMLQRIGLAQALINDPEFLILDEPMSGLDPIGRKEVRDIILRLKDQGRTVIFSSHILSDVESICDRIGILINGKLQFVDRLENVINLEVESVEMTVSGLNEAGKKVIQSLGGQVMITHDDANKTVIVVHGVSSHAGEESISNILSVIREFDAKLISMMSQTRSLEDLFVKLNDTVDKRERMAKSIGHRVESRKLRVES